MSQFHVRRSRYSLSLASCLLAAGLSVSACGDDAPTEVASEVETSAEPTPAPTASQAPSPEGEPIAREPACADVWVDEEPLPDPYRGCYESETFVKAESQRCAFGAKLFTHDDRFYAAQFEQVNETSGLTDDAAFQKALDLCGG